MGHLAKFRRLGDFFRVLGHFLQVRPEGLAHEQAFGVLGQHGQAVVKEGPVFVFFDIFPEYGDFSPIGSANAADGLQKGGFSRAVSADDGKKAPRRDGHVHSPQNIRCIFFIAEPGFPDGQRRRLLAVERSFFRQFRDTHRLRDGIFQPLPPFPDGQGAFP